MLVVLTGAGQNDTFDYFGLPGPGTKIELFAPETISLKKSKEMSLAISPLGNEVFFSKGTWPTCKIMHMKKTGSQWTKPEIAQFSTDCFATEPAFSPNGKYLYYSSSKGMKDKKQYCIWRVEKGDNGWINAKKVIDIPTPGIWEFHPSITNDGTVYFCFWDSKSNQGSIYKSDYRNGRYSVPRKVTIPFEKPGSVTNPFIDAGGKYIITSSAPEDGKNGYDAFISYKNGENWSEPVNFGKRFNTPEDDDSFDISPDGKFLFIYRQDDVYWTETKEVIN